MTSDNSERIGDLLCFTEANVDGEWTDISELCITERRIEILKMLEQIKNGEVSHPRDIVDEWKPQPETSVADQKESTYEYVSLSDVIGTSSGNIDRLEPRRLRRILTSIYFRGFDIDGENSVVGGGRPRYILIDDEFYVHGDGVHRTLACKALGIEEIYAFVRKTK